MDEAKRQDSAAFDFASQTPSEPCPSPKPQPPNPFHRPNTGQNESDIYVLTLSLTPSISAPLDRMRRQYFPKELNRTPAHVTLFHALPHSRIQVVDADLRKLCPAWRPYRVSTGPPFRMRRGVAVLLDAGNDNCQHLREELRERWEGWLSEQDGSKRGWQPHWTVMNKVDDKKKVEQAFLTLRRMLCDDVERGRATGLVLWRYDAGEWERVREYSFSDREWSGDREGMGADEEVTHGAGRESRNDGTHGALKKGADRVAGIWKAITHKKGVDNHGQG